MVLKEATGVYKERSRHHHHMVQELCESRGGRLGLSVLTSLLVSVDVKLNHASDYVNHASALVSVCP